MDYDLPINGVYWGYNLLTNLLLTSWDIQAGGCGGVLDWNNQQYKNPELRKASKEGENP